MNSLREQAQIQLLKKSYIKNSNFLKDNELSSGNLASHLRMKKSNVGKITKKLEATR